MHGRAAGDRALDEQSHGASFLALVEDHCQFIIATHARIVLAYPGATIYHLSDAGIASVAYEDTEHVSLTRDFSSDRERVLRRLLRDDSPEG